MDESAEGAELLLTSAVTSGRRGGKALVKGFVSSRSHFFYSFVFKKECCFSTFPGVKNCKLPEKKKKKKKKNREKRMSGDRKMKNENQKKIKKS